MRLRVEARDLRPDRGGQPVRVTDVERADGASPGFHRLEGLGNACAERVDRPGPGDDDPPHEVAQAPRAPTSARTASITPFTVVRS